MNPKPLPFPPDIQPQGIRILNAITSLISLTSTRTEIQLKICNFASATVEPRRKGVSKQKSAEQCPPHSIRLRRIHFPLTSYNSCFDTPSAPLLKRERGASPLLSRSCEPPLMSGVNNRATGSPLPIGIRSAIGGAFREGVRNRAASQKTCRNHHSKHRRNGTPRGLGCNGNDTAMPSMRIFIMPTATTVRCRN